MPIMGYRRSEDLHPAPSHPADPSERKAEVLRLVARGLTNARIGERLFISPRTVNTHLTAIYHKLRVDGRSTATRVAVEQGLA